jgi:arylsulfatase A-like enzyme
MELDDNVGRIMEAIRAEAPNTIVILTADNGAWQDAYPDAGCRFRKLHPIDSRSAANQNMMVA